MRWTLVLLLLMFSASAHAFSGQDLYQLCQRDQAACAQFVRKVLRDEGWPEQVPYPEMTKKFKEITWRGCPTIYPDHVIAKRLIKYWPPIPKSAKQDARRTALVTMTATEPRCAQSTLH